MVKQFTMELINDNPFTSQQYDYFYFNHFEPKNVFSIPKSFYFTTLIPFLRPQEIWN